MKNIPEIIPALYAKAHKDGVLVWGEDCVSATNDFNDGEFIGVPMVRLADALKLASQPPASPVAVPEGQHKVAEGVPLMKAAFRTTATCGPDKLYEMRFAFRDIETLHAADDEWRKFSGLSK